MAQLQRFLSPSGIELEADAAGGTLFFRGPGASGCLRLVRLYRASSREVERAAAPDVLLVLTAPTRKALEAAAHTNHVVLPDGACRLIAPGVALVLDAPPRTSENPRRVQLAGRTGVVAETLLLGGQRRWSVTELAFAAHVSPALAQRVLTRLEQEQLVHAEGSGPKKVRVVRDLRALAELWSQEEKKPRVVVRGFLYGASPEVVAQGVLSAYPEGAVGGAMAANLSRPTLTRVPFPVRVWVGCGFDPASLLARGLERTEEGANVELVEARGDPWRVHREAGEVPRVSRARAWAEIAEAGGRVRELADALLAELEGEPDGRV